MICIINEFIEHSWKLQYFSVFTVWGLVAVIAILNLSGPYGNRFSVACLWAAIWYLSIQIHWIINEADKHPGYTEWWWSGFETLVGVLIIQSMLHQGRPP